MFKKTKIAWHTAGITSQLDFMASQDPRFDPLHLARSIAGLYNLVGEDETTRVLTAEHIRRGMPIPPEFQ